MSGWLRFVLAPVIFPSFLHSVIALFIIGTRPRGRWFRGHSGSGVGRWLSAHVLRSPPCGSRLRETSLRSMAEAALEGDELRP
eukprot:scaffold185025_cov43-Prasinocladus_malaysianus.AAC.2